MFTLTILLAAAGDGFFDRAPVDFWGTRRTDAIPRDALWAGSDAPPPVRRLLEAPSAANATAYLEWQRGRLEGLRAAMRAVEEARGTKKAEKLLYFSRADCRWCTLQERELHGLPVERVPEGSPLWKEHGVTVTPTIVAGDRVFRGFTPRRDLEGALR